MEWTIVEHLSDSTPARHPWNRTIPIMDIIHTRHYVVLVQAYWGTIPFIPPCDTLVTRLHVAKQVLEVSRYIFLPLGLASQKHSSLGFVLHA